MGLGVIFHLGTGWRRPNELKPSSSSSCGHGSSAKRTFHASFSAYTGERILSGAMRGACGFRCSTFLKIGRSCSAMQEGKKTSTCGRTRLVRVYVGVVCVLRESARSFDHQPNEDELPKAAVGRVVGLAGLGRCASRLWDRAAQTRAILPPIAAVVPLSIGRTATTPATDRLTGPTADG